MNNSITKENIINTALELMRHSNNPKEISMRVVAHSLGCAHTNLYNYISSYSMLLWEAHTALQEIFMETLRNRLISCHDAGKEQIVMFETFIRFYLENIGWYRILWVEYLGVSRPESNRVAVERARAELDGYAFALKFHTEQHKYPNGKKEIRDAIHGAHCYIIGEVSNFISGRGLTDDINFFIHDTAVRASDIFEFLSERE